MQNLIISGFPGIGKSTVAEHRDDVLDLESSTYHWKWRLNELDEIEKVSNIEFPENYIKAIRQTVEEDKYNFIFVSSHETTRNALRDAHIPFIVVIPNRKSKNAYLKRYLKRGSSIDFITVLNNNFDTWISDILNDETQPVIELAENEVLEDILPLEDMLPR